jgi:cysteine synthase B
MSKVGDTPLLRFERVGRRFPHFDFYAKAEWFNPSGSVKDRAALNMILEGEKTGQLKPGRIILDATSGNTGISYAMIGRALGYKVRLTIPDNASLERKRTLKAYDADLVFTDPDEGSDGAIRKAREIYDREPDLYYYPDQYNNPANWKAHYDGTALEIWEQTGGSITHFVAPLGSSGTFIGVTRRLKELNADIHCISLEPDSPFHGLEGMKYMQSSIIPGIYDDKLADDRLPISTEEAYKMVHRLVREEGLLVGISSGAALVGCFDLARKLQDNEPAVIVTVFPDGGERYLSERFWEEL